MIFFLHTTYIGWFLFFFSQKENITPVFSASGLWSVRCFWCGISDGVGLTPRIPFYPFHTFSNSTLYSHLRGLRLPPELSKSSVTALSSTLGGPIVVSAALNQTCWCVDGMSLVWRDERFFCEKSGNMTKTDVCDGLIFSCRCPYREQRKWICWVSCCADFSLCH